MFLMIQQSKESLGWYYFDDEGVETKKTNLIEKGVLKNHMQNRETSKIFKTQPTGNMRVNKLSIHAPNSYGMHMYWKWRSKRR